MNIINVDYDWAGPLVRRTRTELIVLHHSAGSGSAMDIHTQHLRNGWVGIGYHYYIRRDGLVCRGRPEDCIGAHAVGCNDRSIGICFEGNFEVEEMGSAQLYAGARLLRHIWARYGRLGVIGHREAGATACPGRLFPLEALRSLAEDGGMPDGWAKEAVDWAVANGLFLESGAGGGRWMDPVTREELAAVLRRYAARNEPNCTPVREND